MIEKLVYCKYEEDYKKILNYIEDFKGFNQLPTPYEETTFNEFYNNFIIYSPLYTEYRQVDTSYRIYYYADKGYAVHWDQNDPNKSKVYRLGCKHEWDQIKSSKCYSELRCKKCGCELTIDSSD